MRHKSASRQPDLFEAATPPASPVTPAPAQKARLAALVEALLSEIAVALAKGQIGDDQDHD
jgi:hypothetical protein